MGSVAISPAVRAPGQVIEIPLPRFLPRQAGAGTPDTLTAIVEQIEVLLDTYEDLEEGDDELRHQIELDLAALMEAQVRKVDGIARYLSFCEAQQANAAAEIERLEARKKRYERREEWQRRLVLNVMNQMNTTKLEGDVSTLRRRRCTASVDVTDESLVPREFFREKTEYVVSKTLIIEAIQNNQLVPGARLVTDKYTLLRS